MNVYKKNYSFSVYEMLVRIFVNIKEESIIFNKLLFIFCIIENINYIIIIDIIFNKYRDFINFFSILYFINPLLYYEYINNKNANSNISLININNENIIFDKENYKYDQLSLIINKFFKINIYEQNYFHNNNVIKLLIIFFIFVFYLISSIKGKKQLIKYIRMICLICLYILLKPFLPVLMILFGRTMILQLSENIISIKFDIIFDIIFYVIFFIEIYIFYFIIIYSYGNNENIYFLKLNIFPFEFLINIFNSFILILRFNIKYSIIFQFLWIFFVFIKFYYRIKYFNYSISKNFNNYMYTILNVFIISYLITRIIMIFLIFYISNVNLAKYFEIILFTTLFILIFYFINKNLKIIHLEDIEKLKLKKSKLMIFSIFQIFEPLKEILNYTINSQKINDKMKENILNKVNYNFKNYLCTNKNDYLFINNNISEIEDIFNNKNTIQNEYRNSIKYNSRNSITSIHLKYMSFHEIINILLDYFNSLLKENNNVCNEYIREIIIYYELLLYYLLEERSFRFDYILMKFIYHYNFYVNNNIIGYSIFEFINNHFVNNDKIINSTSMELVIIYDKINYKYIKLIKCFKNLLINYSHNLNKLIKFTLKENKVIGIYLKKIISLKKKTKFLIDNKDNNELEKYKLCEAILFNSNFHRSVYFFDLQNINILVNKNNIFILKFEINKITIKKTPKTYIYLTDIKTSKLHGKHFLEIFPECIRSSLLYELEFRMMTHNTYHIITVLTTLKKLIILTELTFIRLPTYHDNLYISCKLDNNNHRNNCLLINESGVIYKFGYFFVEYFGLKVDEKPANLFFLLNIEENNNIEILKKNKIMTVIINYNKFVKNIENTLKRYQNQHFGLRYKENLLLLKKECINKKIHIKLELKNIFQNENKKYDNLYLLLFSLENLREEVEKDINKNTYIQLTLMDEKLEFSINQSVASAVSQISPKNEVWYITGNIEHKNLEKKLFIEKISFIYNIFLILLAIIIIFIVKKLSQGFENDFIFYFYFTNFNTNFLFCHVYLINKIILIDDNNDNTIYNSLEKEFLENNLKLNVTDFFNYKYKKITIFLNDYYVNQIKNNLEKKSELSKVIKENFSLYSITENYINSNYYTIFPLQIDYLYVLSNIKEDFYINLTVINYENFLMEFPKINSYEIRILYILINNYFPIFEKIESINQNIKIKQKNDFHNFSIIIIVLLITFLVLNLFSLVLLFLIIYVFDKKILFIIKSLSIIEDKKIYFLKKKLKYVKQLINNEKYSTEIVEKIKNEYKSITKKKKKNNDDKQMINENINQKNDAQMNDNKHFYFNQNNQILKNKEKITFNDNYDYSFPTENKIHTNLLQRYPFFIKYIVFILIIYIIYSIITLQYSIYDLNFIDDNIKIFFYTMELQTSLIDYYISNKYFILYNTTYINNINLNEINENIFNNFLNFMISITKEKNTYNELINQLNSGHLYDYFLNDQLNYTTQIIEICKFYNVFRLKLITIISAIIDNLKQNFSSFKKSSRNITEIQNHFQNIDFQFTFYLYLVYILDILSNILKDIFYDKIIELIKNNKFILIIIFILMVFIEISNYFQISYLILSKFSFMYENYLVIERFFIDKGENKNEK